MLKRVLPLACAGLLCVWCVQAQEAPPPEAEPQQVSVSVKIVEFQTTKGVETGLSAYFLQRNKVRAWGRTTSGNGNIRVADLTFPSTASAITVFLDNITTNYGDIEVVLQALVDQNRAFILSQPQAMVTVGGSVPTTIKTTQQIPYEDTVVVGATARQVTKFRPTGVDLTVTAPQMIDDDGNLNTNDDTFIQLTVTASVNEEGQRIVVGLADQAGQGGPLTQPSNAIPVPELVTRSVTTTVWVRHGQVLLLGGLYRNTKNKNLTTLPWLTQGEDVAMGLASRVIPGTRSLGSPLSASIGNRRTSEGRRELVFLIKAERWRPAYALPTGMAPETFEADAVSEIGKGLVGVVEGISEIPQGIVEGLTGDTSDDTSIDANLGGDR